MRVVQLATAQDVGFAINPQSVVGQVEGGSAQGLGLALMEELQLEDGHIRNASFTDYLLPTTLDMPPVEVVLVEEPEPDAPFGAKGVGEPANVVAPAAIVSALRAALGRDLQRIPVKPDNLAGLREPPASRRGLRSRTSRPVSPSPSRAGSSTSARFPPGGRRGRRGGGGGGPRPSERQRGASLTPARNRR